MQKTFFLFVVSILLTTLVKAQAPQNRAQDSLAIIATSLDYIDGYYSADSARMQGALHPQLDKRIIRKNPAGEEQLSQMSAANLVMATKSHKPYPADKRRHDVFVTDIFRDAATVKIIANDWIDYLQLHRWHGRWVIVNVLWELSAGPQTP